MPCFIFPPSPSPLSGMELGHHGRPGPPAARPVGLAFRSVRGHAATLLRDTEAGSVSDKAERSGESRSPSLNIYQTFLASSFVFILKHTYATWMSNLILLPSPI